MGEDNIFTLFLKGVFVLILLFMLLALVLPFVSFLVQGAILESIIQTFIIGLFILIVTGLILLITGLFK